MSFDTKRLYELLPAIYRIRDAEQGEPLRALLDIIAGQAAVLEELKKYNPGFSFPTILIGDEIIIGFQEDKVRRALGI